MSIDVDLSESIARLRAQASQADHTLAPATYRHVRCLCDACASDPALLAALRARTPEWTGREYLLNVDREGKPALPATSTLADYRQTLDRRPDFGLWLQERSDGDRPLLLVARWLCHLAGLRHRTVQLLLDHPTTEGYTLLQVRGLSKAEAPGCFDLPCAGHVPGLERVEDALWKELEEELGLDPSDLSTLETLGSYEYRGDPNDPALYNVEYRAVYRSRLRPGVLSRIRFVDGEVAAVAMFAVSEVGRLIEVAPERVASGLAGSWGMYLEQEV